MNSMSSRSLRLTLMLGLLSFTIAVSGQEPSRQALLKEAAKLATDANPGKIR
jgi:hypothetical protein